VKNIKTLDPTSPISPVKAPGPSTSISYKSGLDRGFFMQLARGWAHPRSHCFQCCWWDCWGIGTSRSETSTRRRLLSGNILAGKKETPNGASLRVTSFPSELIWVSSFHGPKFQEKILTWSDFNSENHSDLTFNLKETSEASLIPNTSSQADVSPPDCFNSIYGVDLPSELSWF
jgi:hypothetical protein